MIANWQNATEFPPARIRVLTCDSLGFMQTGFYGAQSSYDGSKEMAWREDDFYGENGKVGYERQIEIKYWDYLPSNPMQKIDRKAITNEHRSC